MGNEINRDSTVYFDNVAAPPPHRPMYNATTRFLYIGPDIFAQISCKEDCVFRQISLAVTIHHSLVLSFALLCERARARLPHTQAHNLLYTLDNKANTDYIYVSQTQD